MSKPKTKPSAKAKPKPNKKPKKLTRGGIGAPTDERLDVAAYARRLTMDVPETLAAVKKILARVPRGARVLEAHARVIADNQLVLTAAHKRVPTNDLDPVRPFDLAVDRAWSAMYGRLSGWDLIADPNASRATKLMRIFFPTGLSFTQLPWSAQWAEGEKRLARVAEEKLEPELRELVGAAFVDALKARQQEYGDALGMHGAGPDRGAASEALMPLLRATLQAVADYAVQLAAAHNAEPDPKKRSALRKAIQPIEDARRAAAAHEGGDGEEAAAL